MNSKFILKATGDTMTDYGKRHEGIISSEMKDNFLRIIPGSFYSLNRFEPGGIYLILDGDEFAGVMKVRQELGGLVRGDFETRKMIVGKDGKIRGLGDPLNTSLDTTIDPQRGYFFGKDFIYVPPKEFERLTR